MNASLWSRLRIWLASLFMLWLVLLINVSPASAQTNTPAPTATSSYSSGNGLTPTAVWTPKPSTFDCPDETFSQVNLSPNYMLQCGHCMTGFVPTATYETLDTSFGDSFSTQVASISTQSVQTPGILPSPFPTLFPTVAAGTSTPTATPTLTPTTVPAYWAQYFTFNISLANASRWDTDYDYEPLGFDFGTYYDAGGLVMQSFYNHDHVLNIGDGSVRFDGGSSDYNNNFLYANECRTAGGLSYLCDMYAPSVTYSSSSIRTKENQSMRDRGNVLPISMLHRYSAEFTVDMVLVWDQTIYPQPVPTATPIATLIPTIQPLLNNPYTTNCSVPDYVDLALISSELLTGATVTNYECYMLFPGINLPLAGLVPSTSWLPGWLSGGVTPVFDWMSNNLPDFVLPEIGTCVNWIAMPDIRILGVPVFSYIVQSYVVFLFLRYLRRF